VSRGVTLFSDVASTREISTREISTRAFAPAPVVDAHA
jgi:hypothetical protein